MAKHEHGSMDSSVQQATFNGFLRTAAIVAVVVIGILIFMALVNG